MVKRSNVKVSSGFQFYVFLYMILLILELVYVIMVWTPYGRIDGNMRPWYNYVRQHLDTFVILSIIVIAMYNMMFPGLGIWALTITLYRVSQLCCGSTRENFGDGLPFAWGTYKSDDATMYDQGELEREQDGSRAAYSAALGDEEDRFRMTMLADLENTTYRHPIHRLRQAVAIFPKDGCGWDEWIVPKIREAKYYPGKRKLHGSCGCEPCDLSVYGSLFESRVKPRPLYTTSLIAKQMKEA